MQGRLSPPVSGKIQAFPVKHWREEFVIAQQIDLSLMEWTIDHLQFHKNPLINESGRRDIRDLQRLHGLRILSVTADNMMQAPFWKASSASRNELMSEFLTLIDACAQIGILYIVVPLVDNGSLLCSQHEASLMDGMQAAHDHLISRGVKVAFESDFEPSRLNKFIRKLPTEFGINFDMGNSAALGWPPAEEIRLLSDRILNVHVKDRVLGGTTVPFGSGNVEFTTVFDTLRAIDYRGLYIIQGARAADGDHIRAVSEYAKLVEGFLSAT